MRRVTIHLLVASALSIGFPTGAGADVSLRLSNAQLTAQSDTIVIGRAVAVRSRWIDRTLVTAVTVQISESIKGASAETIEVLLPGGVDARPAAPADRQQP